MNDILEKGFEDKRLRHFPAFQNYDQHSNVVLNWNWRSGCWKIVDSNVGISQASYSITSGLVISQLETKGLVFGSRLKAVAHLTLPWIPKCVKKLETAKLDDNQLMDVLSFVSCVGLMMNGWYVEYSRLDRLRLDMPLNQHRLQDLEILSKLLMVNFNKFRLFRLHDTIPHRLPDRSKTSTPDKVDTEKESTRNTDLETYVEEETVNRISDEIQEIDTRVEKTQPMCLPFESSRLKRKWTSDEHKCLGDKYEGFKAACLSRKIPI